MNLALYAMALALGASCTMAADVCPKYVVQSGDSLYSIQQKFNLLADDLVAALQACGQSTDLLQVGQEICLPGADLPGCANVESFNDNANCKVYVVQQGDTLNSVASALNIYTDSLGSLNQDVLTASYLPPNKYLKLPPWSQKCGDPNNSAASCRVYIVSTGDFIAGIAAGFRVTVDELLAANAGLTQDSVLQNGQPIKIPPFPASCGAGTPTKPPTDTVIRCRGYRVLQGDNIQTIAQAFKTTVNEINNANPDLAGGSLVQPGTVIKIPPYDSSCDAPILVTTTPPGPGSSKPQPPSSPIVVNPSPVSPPVITSSPAPAAAAMLAPPLMPAAVPMRAPAPVPAAAPMPAPEVDSTAAAPTAPPAPTASTSGTSVGAIVGGVVGGLAVVAAVVAGIVLVQRRKRRRGGAADGGLPTTSSAPVNGNSNGATSLLDAHFATSPPSAPMPSSYHNVAGAGAATGVVASGAYHTQSTPKWNIFKHFRGADSASSQPPTPASAPPLQSPTGSSSLGARSTAGMDPLMQYINSTMAPSLASRTSSNLAAWELNFADLQIEHPIGEGSWGRVYKAKWHETPVAVKVLLDAGIAGAAATGGSAAVSAMGAAIVPANDPMLARLQQEAGLISSLHHPNIVQFLGMTLTPATLVSEYCIRGSLMDVLRAGKASPAKAKELDWPRRMAMAADASLGMIYLHSRSPPIIHRDLKSPNLLVDASWKVKVSDFGLSKIMEDSSRWLPPEVLNGESATPAADVFAFGVVMWELMTWELPWGTANPWGIVGAINQGRRPEIPAHASLPGEGSAAWPGLPRYMKLMKRCWAQEPQARPTFQEVVAELRDIEPSIQT